MRTILKIGSRGSKLALQQTEQVAAQLENHYPALQCEIVKIKTEGDKILDVPLAKIGGKGLFVKELDEALLDGSIDLAVHSMKDVPTELPPDLTIAAITHREDPRDVLISRNNAILRHLPKDAVIGTCSLRRQSQLLAYSPDFQIVQLRGNLETRLRRVEAVEAEGMDAVIIAAAGLHRMGWHKQITEYLPMEVCLPAIAQGALGIEIRKDQADLLELLTILDHQETRIAVLAERAFLKKLEGGCQVPIAAYGLIKESTLILQGMVGSLKGDRLIRDLCYGSIDKPEELGLQLAQHLLNQGAGEILKEIYTSEA